MIGLDDRTVVDMFPSKIAAAVGVADCADAAIANTKHCANRCRVAGKQTASISDI